VNSRVCLIGIIVTLAVGCGGAGSAGSVSAATSAATSDGATAATSDGATAAALQTAFVKVTLATLWVEPDALRAIDAPSASVPVDMPRWLASMSTADRAWLVGRLQTQAAYGTRVVVLSQNGGWSKVAVRSQPSQLNRLGYPGWVPTRQLTTNGALLSVERTRPVAVVIRSVAWLRDPSTLAKRIAVTFATRLWVMGSVGDHYLVETPGGQRLAIAHTAVAKYASVAMIPHPTGARIVAVAKRFLRLPYLWAGTSAYGFDCSGFTYTVFRRFGISVPRDADRQALHGTPVSRSQLRLGDLVFFAGAGGVGMIHHVGIYAGSGMMIDSPRTGASVRIVAMTVMGSEYAGARRYL
jgi:gamma-D-glutamyl-L-lysine dipeptidyl-peptidase